MSAENTNTASLTAEVSVSGKMEILNRFMNDPNTSESAALKALLFVEEHYGPEHSTPAPSATPLLIPPPRNDSTGSTPSATSEADEDEETREINAEEIPEAEESETTEESYQGAPPQFASHIFFQKGLRGGNGVNFTLTNRKGRRYIQVSQAEDESVPVEFFRDCLDHATGLVHSVDETEELEARRQNEFTDLSSCATGAAAGMFFLLWMWYIISGVVQMSARKC